MQSFGEAVLSIKITPVFIPCAIKSPALISDIICCQIVPKVRGYEILLLHQQAVDFIPIAMTIASYGGVTQRAGGVTAAAPRLAIPWHNSTAIIRESECCIIRSTSLTDSPQVSFAALLSQSYQHLGTNASTTLRLQPGTTFCPDNRSHQATDMFNLLPMQSSETTDLTRKTKS